MFDEKRGKIVGEQLKIVVENQLKSGEPASVVETYERLKKTGTCHEEAIRMMAHCLARITFDMLKNKESYDQERYSKMLAVLPDEDMIYKI